jgi:ABC-type transport system involved in cytochrome bd biosynthesis fused ATPase/permease subunit
VFDSERRHNLELGSLARQVRAPVAALAMLGAIRILVLPLSAYCIKTSVPLYLPLAVGFLLEPLRSAMAILCRRTVRRDAMVGFASEALDATRLDNSGSAMRAAFVAERSVSVEIPGFGAGLIATGVLLVLGASRLGTGLVMGVLFVLLAGGALGIVMQRQRRPLHRAVVSAVMKLGAWMSVASNDQGEVSADTSRRNYFRQVARSSDAWSATEARLERSRLWLRASVGLVVAIGLALVVMQGDLPLALRQLEILKSRQLLSIADFIVLASAIPSLVLAVRHGDALLSGHSELTALRPMRRTLCRQIQRMEQRPQQLSIAQLEVRYQSELGVRIEELCVELTEPVILVGANGCGKSTLLATIAGSLETAQGSVLVDGVPSELLDRSQVALVPQEPVLVEDLTLLENAQLVVPMVTPMELSAYLEALGLRCDVNDALGSLSRGERRRVAIARALLKYPRLLLLDEPDAWLDAHGRQLLLEALAAIKGDTAIIIVTHRLEMACFGKTIVVLGPEHSLEAVGTLEQLQKSSGTFRAVVGQ